MGFYRVGRHNTMSWGADSYLLDGLSTTNSNARQRQILIHPWYTVKSVEIYPVYTSMYARQGCFVLNPQKFKRLTRIIDRSKRSILLYAYSDDNHK